MSAVIVDHDKRSPYAPEPDRLAYVGDWYPNVKRAVPGQLWERVAETSEKSFRYVWRGGMPRGPLVANGWQVDAHGIIHAGVRVK